MILTKSQVTEIAKSIGVDYASLMAFISVESGGVGFATDTGKIIIQFEPVWFKKNAPYAPSGACSLNKVERQSAEYRHLPLVQVEKEIDWQGDVGINVLRDTDNIHPTYFGQWRMGSVVLDTVKRYVI